MKKSENKTPEVEFVQECIDKTIHKSIFIMEGYLERVFQLDQAKADLQDYVTKHKLTQKALEDFLNYAIQEVEYFQKAIDRLQKGDTFPSD